MSRNRVDRGTVEATIHTGQIVAILLVLIAYAVPLWQHLRMQTYGSPGFSPF